MGSAAASLVFVALSVSSTGGNRLSGKYRKDDGLFLLTLFPAEDYGYKNRRDTEDTEVRV